MHRKPLLHALERYKTSSLIQPDEQIDQIIEFIATTHGCFDRNTHGHVTGSAWVVSHDYTKVLLTHHKKLNKWIQLGGHADNNPDIPAVALQEAYEESGIKVLALVSPEIYDIDIHPLPNACAYHYDVRYLIRAPEGGVYTVSEESHDLAWVPLGKVSGYTTDRSVTRMVEKMAQACKIFTRGYCLH